MKKIINGKRYDTDTAKEIGSWSNRLSYSDFGHCEESLYRTKTGNYFIAGSGGPMTAYRTSCGNNCWGGGESIRPVSEQEALQWLEEHNLTDSIEKWFSDLIVDA